MNWFGVQAYRSCEPLTKLSYINSYACHCDIKDVDLNLIIPCALQLQPFLKEIFSVLLTHFLYSLDLGKCFHP